MSGARSMQAAMTLIPQLRHAKVETFRQTEMCVPDSNMFPVGGEVLLTAYDYQLLCLSTRHVPQSIQVWTKYPHFA